MNLGVEAVRDSGRQFAEALMVPGLRVKRHQTVTLPDYTTQQQEILVYEGIYKLTTYEPDSILLSSAGRPVITQEYRLHVPVGVGPFQIGDVAHVPGHDRPFLIDGLLEKTYQTAQRLKVTIQPNAEDVGDAHG